MAKYPQRPLSPSTTESFDSSTPSCTAAATGTYPVNEQQLQLINQLMDDKDRLLKEKDELVEGKNKLWQKYHEDIGDRDKQIEELRINVEEAEQQADKQKRRNHDLIKALKKQLAREADADEDDADESPDHAEHQSDAEKRAGDDAGSNAADEEQSEDGYTFPDQENSSVFDAPEKDFIDDVGSGRRFADDKRPPVKKQKISATTQPKTRSIHTFFPRPASKTQPPKLEQTKTNEVIDLTCSSPLHSSSGDAGAFEPGEDSTEQPKCPSLLSDPMRADPSEIGPGFTARPPATGLGSQIEFTAVVSISESGESQIGGIDELPRIVQASLESYTQTLKERGSFARSTGHLPTYDECGWGWMHDPGNTQWTLERAAQYACKTCFNQRRACFRIHAGQRAVVLPLPPQTRGPDSTIRDEDYYIRPEDSPTARTLAGIWQDGRVRKRKRLYE